MKRVLSLFLSCVFVLGVCFSTPIVASAAENTVSNDWFEYVVNSEANTCKIVGYNNTEATSINIPEGITIGEEDAQTSIEVASVSGDAFEECTNLEYVFFSGAGNLWDGEVKLAEGVAVHTSTCNFKEYVEVKDEDGDIATIYETCTGCEKYRGRITLVATKNATYGDEEQAIKVEQTGKLEKVENSAEGYTLSYLKGENSCGETVPTDAGSYTATLTYQGKTITKPFTIAPKTITEENITLTNPVVTYTGSEQLPEITVKDGETPLTEADYTITYKRQNGDDREETSDLTSVGTIFVEVAGKGNYTGIVTKEYVINKAELTITIEEPQQLYVGNDFNNLNWSSSGLKGTDQIKSISFEDIGDEFSEEGEFALSYESAVIENEAGNDVTKNYNVMCDSVTVNIVVCAHDEIEEGKDATCQNKAVCKTCGEEFGEKEPHNWEFTADGAVITATCQTEECPFEETPVTITLEKNNEISFEYDGKEKVNPVKIVYSEGAEVALGDILTGVSVEYTYDGQSCTVKNAGKKYSASVTLGEQTATLPFVITEKELTDNNVTITGIEDSYVHTGEEIKPLVVVKDGGTELSSETDYDVSYSNNTDVGTATVTITFKGNYSGTVKRIFEIVAQHVHSWSFEVVEDENGNKISATCEDCPDFAEGVTITLEAKQDLVYTGETIENPVVFSFPEDLDQTTKAGLEELLKDKRFEYIFPTEDKTVKNAGKYIVKLILVEANEAGEGEISVSVDFEILQKEIRLGILWDEFCYDANSHEIDLNFDGVVNADDAFELGKDYSVQYYRGTEITKDFTSVGTISVVVTLNNGNYIFETNEEDKTSKTLKYIITPAPISEIEITTDSEYTYTGSQIKPNVNVKINGSTELANNKDYTVTYEYNVNAGTGTVTVVFSDNYEYVGDPEDLTKIFTINKAIPDVEKFEFTAPENLTYDGNEKTATVVVKDGVTGMGAITIKYYDANEALLTETPKAEGTYTVKINVAEGTNFVAATEITSDDWKFTIKAHEHDWKYTASGAVIIATCQNAGCDVKDEIKLEINEPTSDYLVYNGEAKQVTYTITEGYEELFDEATISYIGDCVDAGNYTAYVEIGDATARLSFEISKAVIVVTKVTAIDRVYDGNLVVSINKTDGIVYTGLIDGDKVDFDLSALTGTLLDANFGSNKTVKVNGSIVLTGKDAKNYDVSTPGVTNVNITPATLTVTPNAKSSEQYYSLPALDYKVTGLIGSDKLTEEPTLTTNADIKKVGNYTITASGAEASANYTITYAPATLTITEHKNHIVKDGTWKETVHGTCMVAGKEAGTCTLCSGTVTRDSKTDPNNHALITTVTKLQTCTQNGEALVTCANGCKYSLKTAVPADGKNHDFAEDFTVIASTCVAKGSKYKVCQNPGCKVVSEKTEIAINPDAHKNIVTVNAKDATCETKGYTGDKVCNDCKKTTDPGMEINAKGHTESDWIIDKEPTFTEEGAKHTACTVCKKELKKEVIAKRALETPEVKIENVSNGIKVSWSQDEDATGYTVYSSTYNASTKKWSSWKNRGTAAATKSSWTDKTVTEGVTYRYTVRSVNGTNRSSYKATSGLLYVVAPKVTVSITSTGLLAKWNKVNDATEYVVYRRALVNGTWSSWVVLGTTKAEKNTWSDTSVQSGVTYRYTVRAIVGKVRSGYNTSSSIIYLAQPVLEISNVSNGIQGKWSPIAGATGYTIYRSEYNSSTKKWSKWLTLGTTGATAKTFTDKTVKSGYEYKYTIRAVNGKFRSTYQDSNKLVYLAQPTLKISNVANGIQGSWNQVVGATGYIIYRRELKDGKWSNWTSLGTTKATAKTFTDKTVKSGVTYRYTVRATNGVTRSSFASTGSLVFLSVPTVKISSGIKGVNVSWSKIEGATSYLVYRREVANGKWTSWSVITTVTEPTFIDETAKSGTQYRYTVRAVNGSSKSTYTSTSTLNYLAAPTVKLEKLSDSIKVNWTQVTGVTGYTIYRAELGADGKWSKWVTLGTATNKYSSCKDKTAKAGVTYKYTVRAVNGKVKSAYIDGTQITNQ